MHEFKGSTIKDLAREIFEHKEVRVDFQYNPSGDNILDLAHRIKQDIIYNLRQPVKEVNFRQQNKEGREYDSWVFSISEPKNNLEAKNYLSSSFM